MTGDRNYLFMDLRTKGLHMFSFQRLGKGESKICFAYCTLGIQRFKQKILINNPSKKVMFYTLKTI